MTKQSGVGLIEVLIAILVLSVGLLGLAGLQSQSLKFNNESQFRTQATFLAMDMADRLRSNQNYARTAPAAYNFAAGDSPTGALTACEASACSPADLAQYDFKHWRTKVQRVLPGGKAVLTPGVVSVATVWQDFTIQISYQASKTAATQTFVYRVRI